MAWSIYTAMEYVRYNPAKSFELIHCSISNFIYRMRDTLLKDTAVKILQIDFLICIKSTLKVMVVCQFVKLHDV